MLEDTGFNVREETDDFLILTCPWCAEDIMFTQFADPSAIRETANRHADHCVARWTRVPLELVGA
jgi:hypothetical protein